MGYAERHQNDSQWPASFTESDPFTQLDLAPLAKHPMLSKYAGLFSEPVEVYKGSTIFKFRGGETLVRQLLEAPPAEQRLFWSFVEPLLSKQNHHLGGHMRFITCFPEAESREPLPAVPKSLLAVNTTFVPFDSTIHDGSDLNSRFLRLLRRSGFKMWQLTWYCSPQSAPFRFDSFGDKGTFQRELYQAYRTYFASHPDLWESGDEFKYLGKKRGFYVFSPTCEQDKIAAMLGDYLYVTRDELDPVTPLSVRRLKRASADHVELVSRDPGVKFLTLVSSSITAAHLLPRSVKALSLVNCSDLSLPSLERIAASADLRQVALDSPKEQLRTLLGVDLKRASPALRTKLVVYPWPELFSDKTLEAAMSDRYFGYFAYSCVQALVPYRLKGDICV